MVRTLNAGREADGGVRSSFGRSVGVLLSGAVLANIVGVLTLPMVSRVYSPQDFGVFAFVVSAASLLSAVISVGMHPAIVNASTDVESRRILAVCVGTAAVLSCVLGGSAVLMSPFMVTVDIPMPYILACVLVSAQAFLSSVNNSLRSYANRRGANGVLFMNSLIGAVSTLVVTLPLGVMGVGAVGLIAGSLGALLLGGLQMCYRLHFYGSRLSWAEYRAVLRRNRSYVAFQFPVDLLDAISSQAPKQIVSAFFGSYTLGIFAMADRLLSVPIRLVGAPVGTVYVREASERFRSGRELSSFSMRLVVKMMILAYPPIIVLILWGGPLFSWLLGSGWSLAGMLAGVLAVQGLFLLVRTCLVRARVVLNRQSVNLVMSGIRLVLEFGALVVGGVIFENVLGAVSVFAVSSTVFSIVDVTLTMRLMQGRHWRFFWGSLVYCLSILGCWFLVGLWQ